MSFLTACHSYLQKPMVETDKTIGKIAQPLVVDSDEDGITDSQDTCPTTEKNVVVDAHGCPILMEIDLGIRGFFHAIYPKYTISPPSKYVADIEKATTELKQFSHQWIILAVFDGQNSLKDTKNIERLNLLKNDILRQDKKITPQRIVMYDCKENRQFLVDIQSENNLAHYFGNINSPQAQLYAFFTNMSREFNKQNILLSQQCQRVEQ